MKQYFNYLSLSKHSNATKAITFHSFFTNSFSVVYCNYNYYDPVKGYQCHIIKGLKRAASEKVKLEIYY